MTKFIIGLVLGVICAFPLGINFGRDLPLLSNPFATKPDISQRVRERTDKAIEDAKEVIHDATKPAKEKSRK